MSYTRVIPRDLFNEANLLKCLGQLYIELERTPNHKAAFGVEDVESFDIQQDENDGSIYVANLPFFIRQRAWHLYRPLNSRQPWPLWIGNPSTFDFDPVNVFDADGKLSADMLLLIRGQR